jgi:sensor histidine kinase YesM
MGYYSVMGDIKKAAEFNEKSTEALHRYDKKQLSLKIILLQREYENELLVRDTRLLETDIERKSLQLSRSRLILILIGGSSLFIILFLYWYFQRIRLKSSLKILETEHALLRSQMNPHFLFNMITSIQNFIVKEQPQKASLFLSRFSKLVRNILDHSSEEFIPLEKEIETLEHYLELQKNRYGDLFEYTISIDEQLDEFNTRIPAMMLQPFIENAIDHGIKPKKSKGRIGIRFIQKGQETWVEVEDNGVGREKAAELKNGQIHNKHLSRATFLIQQRIDVLNRKYHIKIYFEIIDLTDDVGKATGTLVRIILPEKY